MDRDREGVLNHSIGIAMVGCGQIAEAHLKGVATVAGARLSFCVDVDADRAKQVAGRYDGAKWSVSYQEALADPEVDAVVLCLPHDLHLPFTVQAAQAGKHVLVEKPMALNEREAREMVAAAAEANVQLSVGQSTRFLPAFQEAKRVLDAGLVGRVVQVIHQRTFWVEQLSTDWRRSQEACGGLYLPLFGSHDVDAILWLLNDAPSRVWGAIRSQSQVSAGDSFGFMGLEFNDGKLGSLAFSVQSKHTHVETLFVGDQGALSVQRSKLLLNGEPLPIPESEGAFVLQMRRFVEALLSGDKTPTQGGEIVNVMRTLDLVREASAKGTPMVF